MTPLTHAEARQRLHDGRRWLDNKSLAALDAHLAECAECRAYAQHLETFEPALTRALHARWDGVEAAPATGESAAQRTRARRVHPAFVVAGIGLVVAVIV